MRRLALGFLFWIYAASAQPAGPAIFSEIGEILRELGSMTGLKPPAKVASDTITKDRLKEFLDERLKEVVKPEEIRAEEITLKMFGLAPADFDLRRITVDLLTEQAAAFYDYRKKKLFLLEASANGLQRPVLVHELAHALADAHFDLEKYIFKKGKSDDGALARQSVMEGQATWLMSEWVVRQMGASLRKAPEMAENMSRLSAGSGSMFPVFDSAPLYLKESLMFPYTKGFVFQHAVIVKMGDEGFKEVFRRPPLSSQQILHPQKYFDRVAPTEPKPPRVRIKGYKDLVSGVVGEFDHEVMLRQYAGGEGAAAAAGWRGAFFRIQEDRHDKSRHALLYTSEWESPDAAAKFFGLYRKVLEGKWKDMKVNRESASEITGEGGGGFFRTWTEGSRVHSVEGLPNAGS
ncbi:MAG: hypothetical protein SFV51_10615 [Bryobacteraceae bacterium]|nr:hypothetical protein [Bryobacteraceae bacterium]